MSPILAGSIAGVLSYLFGMAVARYIYISKVHAMHAVAAVNSMKDGLDNNINDRQVKYLLIAKIAQYKMQGHKLNKAAVLREALKLVENSKSN